MYGHRRMGTLWLGGAEGLICPKFYTDNHKHPPPPLGHCPHDVIHPPKIWKLPLLLYSWTFTSTPPPLGHCLCDVIIHIPKGLICSFLWPIFSSCFARISPIVCPNFTHCLPEFGGAAAPPAPPPHTPMCTGCIHTKSSPQKTGGKSSSGVCLAWPLTPVGLLPFFINTRRKHFMGTDFKCQVY